MDNRNVFRKLSCALYAIGTIGTTHAAAAGQYFHCQYLDSIEANWNTGRFERKELSSSQYVGKKFSIERITGEIKGIGDNLALALFPPFKPEVAKADHHTDNYQLIWRSKHISGYVQVVTLNVREGQGSKTGPYQFTQTTTTDWFLSGLCYPSFRQ
jgi:hypothetical protein